MKKNVFQLSPERKKVAARGLGVLRGAAPRGPFDAEVLEFLTQLSGAIMSAQSSRRSPELAALAFWLRRSNLERIKKENGYFSEPAGPYRILPRGLVFHVCPSNVDTMFLYSLAVSLLAGNRNVVRISEKLDHTNIDIIFGELNKLMKQKRFRFMAGLLSVVTYGHDEELNRYFSKAADVRVIWGGDATIALFKSYPAAPGAKDLVFRDRVSCAVIAAQPFNELSAKKQAETAKRFYNDSYPFDQKACSSPQTIFVLGNRRERAKFEKRFYALLLKIAEANYGRDAFSLASLKFLHLAEDAVRGRVLSHPRYRSGLVFAEPQGNPLFYDSCGGGYFYVRGIDSSNELLSLLNEKVQTIGYFGLNAEERNSILASGRGVDRMVPLGAALEFDYIWDSYNLVEELTRRTVSK